MCGHHKHTRRSDATTDETGQPRTYTGETISLRSERMAQSGMRWQRGGFPFWMLWLIWPLIGALKAAAPALIGGAAAVAQLTVSLWPVALIILGILLLRRR